MTTTPNPGALIALGETRYLAPGELGRRLREMGLVPGMNVRIMGRAPLKDPVAVRIMGSTLSLRNGEADQIEVEVANL